MTDGERIGKPVVSDCDMPNGYSLAGGTGKDVKST